MSMLSFRRSIQPQLILVSILSLMVLAVGLQVFWTVVQHDGLVSEGRVRSLTVVGSVNNTIEAVRPLINSLEDISELSSYLSGLLAQNEDLDFIAVIWRDGTVIFHSSPSWQGQRVPQLTGLPLEESPRMEVPGFGEVYLTTRLYQSGDLIGPAEFEVIVAVPVEPIDARLQYAFATSVLITTLAVLLTGGVLVAVLRSRVILPLADLTQTARDIQHGDLSLRVNITREDEIGELGASFNAMATRLTDLIDSLESRVADRTRDLEAASAVARQITTTLDLDELLQQVVTLVTQHFDLYASVIFLLDDDGAVLEDHAGVVSDGSEVTALRVGPIRFDQTPSVVSAAARIRKPVLMTETQGDTAYLQHKSLPRTRAEMAIPLMQGNELLGIFVVQSVEEHHFDSAIQQVMITLAEQVAIAVRNAQLFAEATEARAEAEEASHMKSQFLASMSHELRTPMNAILNFTEFVADGELGTVNDQQVATLRRVIESGEHLLSLINDILDMTKIEVGMMELLVEPFDLGRVLDSAFSTGQVLLRENPEVVLVAEIEPDLPIIYGDRRRIRQLVLNLLANAIKFTESGAVTLGAHRQADAVHFFVKDTGAGIEKDDFEKIFRRFRQTQVGIEAGSGTGLGLPICKYLAEAHGGRIWVESEVGVGSVFHVTIPTDALAEAVVRQEEV